MPAAPRPQAAGCALRYEQLRAHALAKTTSIAGAAPLGLSVLTRQGMSVWMRLLEPMPEPSRCAPTCNAQGLPLDPAGAWQKEATLLLANMALLHLAPAAAASPTPLQ